MAQATTLDQARKVLDPRPLEFLKESHEVNAPNNPRFYAELPVQNEGKLKVPGPIEKLRRQILASPPNTKMFLSGHVGSGKSTELNRLVADKEIREEFSVTTLRFEEQEWATLDSMQLRFRVAVALYDAHKEKLGKKLEKKTNEKLYEGLRALNDSIFQPTGVSATDGSISLEFDLIFVKMKQDLKLSEKARNTFRTFGETQRSVMKDFVDSLVNAVEEALSKTDEPPKLLMIVDDLDKVRRPEQQQDIFEANLNALLALPLRMVLTLPTGVLFGESRADIRQNVVHLYPVRVLQKAPGEFDPEKAFLGDRLGFFEKLLEQRVRPGLIKPDAIRLAAIHSGGVLRDFLRLLREGANLAAYNDLTELDAEVMRYAIKEARLAESIGLYGPDYDVLAQVHQSNELPEASQRKLLDLTRVIECYNGAVWFDANPLLWPLLSEHQKRKNAQPAPTAPATSG